MKRKMLIILVLTLILTVADCWYSMYLNPEMMPAMAATCNKGEGGRIVSIDGGGVQIKRNNNPFNPFNSFVAAQVGTTLCCEDDLKPGNKVRVTISCNNLGENRDLIGDGGQYSVYNTCLPSQEEQKAPCGRSGSGGNIPGKS